MRFEEAIGLWREGQRRLQDADPDVRPAMDRVVDAIVDELRRRLGGAFTTQELARLYGEQGTDWCFDVAVRAAPSFARYVREASDYAGGRRVAEEA